MKLAYGLLGVVLSLGAAGSVLAQPMSTYSELCTQYVDLGENPTNEQRRGVIQALQGCDDAVNYQPNLRTSDAYEWGYELGESLR